MEDRDGMKIFYDELCSSYIKEPMNFTSVDEWLDGDSSGSLSSSRVSDDCPKQYFLQLNDNSSVFFISGMSSYPKTNRFCLQ